MIVPPRSVTGLVLAGGRGRRMGGVDKGLQPFCGKPLALNALQRLRMQHGLRLADCMLNANRHLATYASFDVPVWPDTLEGYAGPLAGFQTGLERCKTPYLLTVPCDAPRFPLDLLERLAHALEQDHAEIAMAAGPEGDPSPTNPSRPQPVFCLMHVDLLESLVRFTQAGGRKIDAWTAQHRTVIVPFDQPGDDPLAFCNTNTLDELRAIESRAL